jgi:long-chain acyl-CoA synthetase
MTETAAMATSTPTLAKRKPGSIGLPVIGTECKIVDLENGVREVPQGEEGELCIRGPQVMKGYWNKQEETAKTIRDGWLYTGDVARMDKVPSTIEFIQSLPKSAVGKVLRRELKEAEDAKQ